jgi:hypothetical protein
MTKNFSALHETEYSGTINQDILAAFYAPLFNISEPTATFNSAVMAGADDKI